MSGSVDNPVEATEITHDFEERTGPVRPPLQHAANFTCNAP
jgi:hypothetical protein